MSPEHLLRARGAKDDGSVGTFMGTLDRKWHASAIMAHTTEAE